MVYSMLILWILNDHLLKAQFGNVWTGKLSDIAGLVVFPLFMLASYQVIARLLGQWRPQDRAVLWTSIFSTGFIFSAVNLSERWSALFETLIGYLQWPIRATWSLLEFARSHVRVSGTRSFGRGETAKSQRERWRSCRGGRAEP